MSDENVEVVRRNMEAFRTRDANALEAVWDPNGVFHSIFGALEGKVYRGGRSGIEAYLDDIDSAFRDWTIEDEQFVDAGGDRVVASYQVVGQGRGSGVPFDQRHAILFTLRDGKLVEGKTFTDPAAALSAAGVQESPGE